MTTNRSHTFFIDTWFVIFTDSNPEDRQIFLFSQGNEILSDPKIMVPPGVQLIRFNLKTSVLPATTDPVEITLGELERHEVSNPEDVAMFTTDPFQWVTNNTGGFAIPMATPPVLDVQRVDAWNCNIIDCNALRPQDLQETYHTRLITMYRGQVHWSRDPTIVNLPDDIGAGPEIEPEKVRAVSAG